MDNLTSQTYIQLILFGLLSSKNNLYIYNPLTGILSEYIIENKYYKSLYGYLNNC